MPRLAALALLLAPAVALAQTPAAGTVTADATETVRMKPDQARVVLSARVKSPDAATAADEAAEQAKKFAEAVDKLKLKGVKVSTAPLQASKGAEDNSGGVRVIGPGGAGGAVAPKEVQATREVVVTVSDADFAALSEAVEKVQREAFAAGLSGAKANTGYNPFGATDGERIKVTYHRKEGADELTTAALGKAAKKATARAEAIASGLGMKLGAVVSAGEVDAVEPASAAAARISIYGGDPAEASKDDLVDGELVRTVRVRVVYGVTK
jgi:uncharacterized protein YggE